MDVAARSAHARTRILATLFGVVALLVVLPTAPVSAASFHTSSSAAQTTAATSITVTVPAGVTNGDVLITWITPATSTFVINAVPAGWTRIETARGRGSAYYKVAASEPASYNWGFSASVEATAIIGAWSGIDTTDPILAFRRSAHSGPNNHPVDPPPSAAVPAGSELVAFTSFSRGSTTTTTPAGWTMPQNPDSGGTGNSAVESAMAYATHAGGALPTPAFTSSNGVSDDSMLIALRASGAPASLLNVRNTRVTTSTTSGSTLVADAPEGVITNDVLVAFVTLEHASGIVTVSAPGWTLKQSYDLAASTGATAVAFHRVAAGDPATYTFDYGVVGASQAVSIVAVRGAGDGGDPIGAIAGVVDSSSDTNWAVPSLTLSAQPAILLSSVLSDRGDHVITTGWPSPHTNLSLNNGVGGTGGFSTGIGGRYIDTADPAGFNVVGETSSPTLGVNVAVIISSGPPPPPTWTEVSVNASPKGAVGAGTQVAAVMLDETGQPVDTYYGTLTATSDDPGAVFPDGSTYAMKPGKDGSGHTFRVLFSTPGTHTVTVTGSLPTAAADTTAPIAVAATDFAFSGPTTVFQGVPFDEKIAPRAPSGKVSATYAAAGNFTSSDSTASYGLDVSSGAFTWKCACDGGHTFMFTLGTLGSQTVTWTDQFGNTGTATFNVLAAPSGGSTWSQGITVSAVQWNYGTTIDYYVANTNGTYFRILAQHDTCSVIGQYSGGSQTEIVVGGGTNYVEFTSHMQVPFANCYISGGYEISGHELYITDDLGHYSILPAARYLHFTDVPGNQNFVMLDPGDPILDIVTTRPDLGGWGFTTGPNGGQFYSAPKGLHLSIKPDRPLRVFSISVAGNGGPVGPMTRAQGAAEEEQIVGLNPNVYTSWDALDEPFSCFAGLAWGAKGQGVVHYSDPSTGRHGEINFSNNANGFSAGWPQPPGDNQAYCDGAHGDTPGVTHFLPNVEPYQGPFDLNPLAAWGKILRDFEEGDPVRMSSGAFDHPETDIALGGLAPSLALTRTYRSDRAEAVTAGEEAGYPTSLFGPGWGSSLDWRIVSFGINNVHIVIRADDGGLLTFDKDDTGAYGSELSVGDLKFSVIGGGYKLAHLDGSGMTFDASGKLASIVSPTGQTLTVQYDGSNHVSSLTDATLRTATVLANGSGQITKVTLPDGRHVDFTYDAPGGHLTAAAALDGTATSYVYDSRGRMVTIKDGAATLLTNIYDGHGRVVKQLDATGNPSFFAYADSLGSPTFFGNGVARVTQIVGALGDVTVDCFNGGGAPIAQLDALDGHQAWSYDTNGYPLRATDALGGVVISTHDSGGHVLSMADPLGRRITAAYDSTGKMLTMTDPTGGSATTTYSAGLPSAVTRSDATHTQQLGAYTYDPVTKQILTITTPGGQVTTYTYDSRGYLASVTDPMGRKTTYVTDTRGFVASSVDPLGNAAGGDPASHTTTFTHDAMGRVLTVVDALGNAPGGSAAAHTTTYTYDSFGRLKTESRASGALTTYGYDTAGRLTSTVQKLTGSIDSTTTYEYDAKGQPTAIVDAENRRTETTYDLLGRPLTHKDANGKVTTIEYDAKGRPTKVTDPTGVLTRTFYDALDRVVKVTDTAGKDTLQAYDPTTGLLTSTTDPLSHTTQFGYDWLGRQTSVTNAKLQTSSVTYNPDGTTASVTNNRNKTTGFTYNPDHQLLTVTEPGDAGNIVTTFAYDDGGRLLTRTNDRGGIDTYEYDLLGRPTKLTDAAGAMWRTFYTDDGQVDHTISGKGETTTFAYDLGGRLLTLTPTAPTPAIGYTYDKTGRPLTMTDGNGTTTYGTDPVGRLASVARGGRTTAYTYDNAGRPLTVAYPASLGSVTYAYDAAGRPSTVSDWASRVTTYHYDDASRVTSVDRPGGLTASYTYDELNRPLTATSVRNSTTLLSQAWTYDANGNIAALTDDTGTASFTYDNLDRLLTAAYPAAQNYAYTYDAVGNTLTAQTPAGLANYAYDLADRITSAGPPPAPDTVAPTAPTGLGATAVGANRINLVWTASTDAVGVTRYTISRSGTPIATVDGSATSFSDFSVAASTLYSYSITASDAAGNTSSAASPNSATTGASNDITAPTTPTGLGATAVGANRINLAWTASTDGVGVTKYTISRGGTPIALVNGTAVTFSDFSVSASTLYSYTVTASDAAGNTSAASTSASATTAASNDTTAPTTPTGLGATAVGANRINLAWTASTDAVGVTKYTISRGGTPIALVNGTAVTFSDFSVSASTLYSYTVTAADAAGNTSTASTSASATTGAGGTPANVTSPPSTNDAGWTNSGNAYTSNNVYATAAPAQNGTVNVNLGTFGFNTSVPSNATVTNVTVSVEWKVSTTSSIATLGSQLYAGGVAKGTEFTNAAEPTADTTQTYTVSGLTRADLLNGVLTIRVRATRGNSGTAFTASLDVVTVKVDYTTPTPPDATNPSTPTGLGATASGSNRINLAWTASTDNVAVHGYKVYRDTVQVGTLPVGTVTFSDTAITAGLHSYTVAGVDGAGNTGSQSTAATATATNPPPDTTNPSTPTGLSATASGSNRINLAWTASTDAGSGVHGYKVYRDTLQVGTLPVGTVTFSDTGITAGLHSYTVAAVDGAGNTGSQSTAATATATNPVGTVPTYDGNGNLLSDGSYGNRTYAYDTLGRLTGVTLGGASTSYALDGAGNRWSQTTAGATTAFDLDLAAANPTVLFDGTAKYLPGAPGLGFEAGGVWKNALTDQLGSPLEYVDTAGVVSGLTHYDPYGVPRPGSTGTVGIGFTGEYRDVTGLINLRARSYDPVMGRFIGRDTFAGIASAPQTANRYAYALANPLRYSDPSGRFVQKILLNPVVWATAASVAMPWVGIAWAVTIAATGYDPVTGEQVSGEGRAFAAATAALGIFGKVAGAVREAWAATEGIEAAGVSTEARLAGGAFGRAEARVAGEAREVGEGAGIGRAVGAQASRESGAVAVAGHEAGEVAEELGIVYRRTDRLGGKPYIGQAKSLSRYEERQVEHEAAHPDARFRFEIVGRARPGTDLDRLEEYFIRQEGGPTNLSNPFGWLANRRHQMSEMRYSVAGGDPLDLLNLMETK